MHEQDLPLRGFRLTLALAVQTMLPSATLNSVGTPENLISQLNTCPACTPVNASPTPLPMPAHDLGPR